MKKNILLCMCYFLIALLNPTQAQTVARTSNTSALTLTFNTTSATSFLNPPYVSGVLNDPLDPAKNLGLIVDVKEDGSAIIAANYTLTASSSKTSVVPNANIVITKADGSATIKITPIDIGYANITLTLTKASSTKTLVINYAASEASLTPTTTYWHTGYSDASAVIALDNDYMVVGDDEKNNLYVVNRKQSGLPVKTYYFGDLLGLTDGSIGDYKEVDVEACVKSTTVTNRVYWLGSMSNAGSSNVYKANSNKLFATTISGTGTATSFGVTGYYSTLRQRLIIWGDANGYNFTTSTAGGHDAKTIDGFNVEGMTIAPDNLTLYIGFRAPLVPTANRTKAVIAPLLNFETWFNNGNPSGNPLFGAPIELNLGGRGIRDIVRLSNNSYIIVAGNYDNTPLNGAIYKWTGNSTDAPLQLSTLNITALNAEACVEIIENGQLVLNKLQIISDNGSTEFYNDGTQAKDLSQDNFKKYRSDIISAPTSVLPIQLESFTAANKNNKAVLNWEMASLSNLASFQILRSLNGKDFSAIANINTSANKLAYTFIDNNVQLPLVYYKIKVVEANGNSYYSTIKTLQFVTEKIIIKTYPNPSTSNFTITTNSLTNKQVQIFTSSGSLFQSFNFTTTSKEISTINWKKGNYLIVISTPSTSVKTELINIQ